MRFAGCFAVDICVCLGDSGLPLPVKSLSGDEELAVKASLSQVLSGHQSHADQVWELLLVLLPPHERVCVVGHLV